MKSRSKDIRYIKKFEGIVSNKTDLRINLWLEFGNMAI